MNFLTALDTARTNRDTNWVFTCVPVVAVFALPPRFIVSIRAMYAHDVQGRRGSGIDTGFGSSKLSTQGNIAGQMALAAGLGVESEVVDNVKPDGERNDSEGPEYDAAHNDGGRDIEEVPRALGRLNQEGRRSRSSVHPRVMFSTASARLRFS
ncbi:hypothetical protein JVU11DRAFT_3027 [Chiua virens]|nr:hypothetical protein JVU11DRAFT_3027 [Chiua virens]